MVSAEVGVTDAVVWLDGMVVTVSWLVGVTDTVICEEGVVVTLY